MSATAETRNPSPTDAEMARVLVMLPVAVIRELDELRASTRISRSTQLRIIVCRAMRVGGSSS